jgi:hypothetical protein
MTEFIKGLRGFRRGAWEMVASILIALGVFMLMQPFACRCTPLPSLSPWWAP